MVSRFKFGRTLALPSVVQIKHQILVTWLADQTALEAAEKLSEVTGPSAAESRAALQGKS